MEYKITWLTLRLLPKAPVNREEFYKAIITALHLNSVEHKFVNVGGNRHYYSVARYKGVNIKLPFYETMSEQGFIIEMTQEGLKTVANCDTYRISELFRCFYSFIPWSSDLTVTRIDIETDYIPKKILALIPPQCLKSNSTVYLGSYRSLFYGVYSENKITYVSRHSAAAFMSEEMFSGTPASFEIFLKDFLNNWKPHNLTSRTIVFEKEPGPSPATK